MTPVATISNVIGLLAGAGAERAELERIALYVAGGRQREAWRACAELRHRIRAGSAAAKAPSESLGGFHAPWVGGGE